MIWEGKDGPGGLKNSRGQLPLALLFPATMWRKVICIDNKQINTLNKSKNAALKRMFPHNACSNDLKVIIENYFIVNTRIVKARMCEERTFRLFSRYVNRRGSGRYLY